MSVLSRVNWQGQQRVDLPHLLAAESYTAFDFRALMQFFAGSDRAFIVQGFRPVFKQGLSVSLSMSDIFAINPKDPNGSFYLGQPDSEDERIELPSQQSNIFVEARFINVTQSPVTMGFWDATSLLGDDPAGSEFSASADAQNVIKVVISVNTSGFSSDALPILRASTDDSNITVMQDARDLLFRLGRGGAVPNPNYRFPWAIDRSESVIAGSGIDNEIDSSFREQDGTGILNDKGIHNLKDFFDALISVFMEFTGRSVWYMSGINSSYITGLNLNSVFFDSISGHSIQPSSDTSFVWSKNRDLKLRSEGITPVEWQANYSQVKWQLGGNFVDSNPGGSRVYTNIRFESAIPVDYGNVYLLLERDVPKGSNNPVKWRNKDAAPLFDQIKTVSGNSGDFTGIAIGDYIRKESEGASTYNRVVRMYNGSAIIDTEHAIADSTVVALELETNIVQVGLEPLRFFRHRYANSDLRSDATANQYTFRDVNYYWLGRRVGTNFILRGYGTLSAGEEINTLNDSFVNGGASSNSAGLDLEHGFGASISIGGTWERRNSLAPHLLTIKRRKSDNLTSDGITGNEDALLEYNIDTDIANIPNNYNVWVRLGESSGTLTAGTVAGIALDESINDNQSNSNVYQVLSPDQTPLGTFDNRNVFLIARRSEQNGQPVLMFCDGSVLNFYGEYLHNHLKVQGDASFESDVYLEIKTPTSVLFTGEDKEIAEDPQDFFYDRLIGTFGVFNYRIKRNEISLDIPEDQEWLPNLGAHTLHFGSSNSTMRIRGNLIVDGDRVIQNTNTVVSDDKVISIGLGNLAGEAGGSGFEIVDRTVNAVSIEAIDTQSSVRVNVPLHGFNIGEDIIVSASVTVGGITAGAISQVYSIIPSPLSGVGNAVIIDANTLELMTSDIATSTETVTIQSPETSFRIGIAKAAMLLSDSSGALSGLSAWSFTTSLVDYRATMQLTQPRMIDSQLAIFNVVPTARASTFLRKRIPFASFDGEGRLGADTTIDFTDRLQWDYETNTLIVHGTFQLQGNFYPQADDTFYIGSTTQRWRGLHAGTDGFIVTNGANTLKSYITGGISSIHSLNNGLSIFAPRVAIQNLAPDADSLMTIGTFFDSALQIGIKSVYSSNATSFSGYVSNIGLHSGTPSNSVSHFVVRDAILAPSTSIMEQVGLNIESLDSALVNYGIKVGTLTALDYVIKSESLGRSVLGGHVAIGSEFDINEAQLSVNIKSNALSGIISSPQFQSGSRLASIIATAFFDEDLPSSHDLLIGLDVPKADLNGHSVLEQCGVHVGDQSDGLDTVIGVNLDQQPHAGKSSWAILAHGGAPSMHLGKFGFGSIAADPSLWLGNVNIGSSIATTNEHGIYWGYDVNLYRGGVNLLKTDDSFLVGSNLTVNGSFTNNGASFVQYANVVTSNYTIASNDYVIPVNTQSSPSTIQIDLPTAIGNKGRVICIKDVGGACGLDNQNIRLKAITGQLIDDLNHYIIDHDFASISLVSNGTGVWSII